jgi:Ser/Thr protein kinase RdoA (MazF antagonist)
LTHGDLHRENIIISSTNPPRVLAVVDWGQTGWYPDYWEYCKALYTARIGGEWREQWIPKILSPRTEEHDVFGEYVHSIGAL